MQSLGLDFGTGNSVLAICSGAQTQVYQEVGQAGSVPSDILTGPGGQIISDPTHLDNPPRGFRREGAIKRRLLSLPPSQVRKRASLCDLAVARLKHMYDAFTQTASEPARKAVLTCPANAGQAYRDILLEIGRRLGLPQVEIVDEPTAAAVHHGLGARASHNERWLVVDWGCGTCDVSLIERRSGQEDLVVHCVKGANDLGGLDMDEALRDHLAARYRFVPSTCRLWEVEALKKRLSTQNSATALLTLADGRPVDVAVTRAELENVIDSLLVRAQMLMVEALSETCWADVDHVIATGGPMLMPCARQTIARAIDWEVEDILWRDPLTSVAQGAARLAELKRVGGLVVTNRVAQTIGVRVVRDGTDDAYHPIIRRGETRPVSRKMRLTTSMDLQDIIAIELREGDNTSALSNTMLGRLNVVVRPESQGAIQVCLQLRLSDSGAMEALIEAQGDPAAVRQVQAAGIRMERHSPQETHAELRLGDPVHEFHELVNSHKVDPDTARQIYERLKVKYHPDRQPERREHWNSRLVALDAAFNAHLAEVERRIRASTLPDLPWRDPAALQRVIVDEVLAQRLAHCLAQGIGGTEKQPYLLALLKHFPDYRRVLASCLFAIKRNAILQGLLAADDRPHVGLVVLLQNLPDKPLHERHEVLKAAYRLPVGRVREMLSSPNLDVAALYEQIPRAAPAAVNPMAARQAVNPGAAPPRVKLQFEHREGNTYISGQTYPVKERLKRLGCRWDPRNRVWYTVGKTLTEKDVWPDARSPGQQI